MKKLVALAPMFLGLALFAATASSQVVVDPSQGADSRVDYPALLDIAPWDDRNYALTQEDLGALAE